LADSNDGGGATGSDFLLVELEDEIPSGWNPYFNGWNAENIAASGGVSIHHPSGDSKKKFPQRVILFPVHSMPQEHTGEWFGSRRRPIGV
jgi:hypothetical protein